MKSAFAACACLLLAAAGCQFINSFDEVALPGVDAGSGGSSGVGASGGAGGNSGSGGAAASGGAGGGGTGGGSGGSTGGTGGIADSGPTREGLIVISGQDFAVGTDPILITLDPATGAELHREVLPQPIRAIAYDAQRDLWFLFQRHDSGDPFDPATLRIGTFNLETGVFEQISSASVPAADRGVIAVLKDRILYKSNLPPVGTPPASPVGFTLLDTTDPTQVVVRGAPQTLLPAAGARGVIARPATASSGGTATLVQSLLPCYDYPGWNPDAGTPPKLCDVQLENAFVGATANAPSFPVSRVVGNTPATGASPGWTSSPAALMMVLPAKANPVDPIGQLLRLRPDNLQEQQPPIPFAAGGPLISSAAYDRCLEVVLATELLTAQSIFVIPTVTGGTVLKEPVPNSAQRVAFEPYTRSVIRPFADNSNPALTAYVLGGTKSVPTLVQRPQPELPWAPPPQLNPDLVFVRDPGTVACPTL